MSDITTYDMLINGQMYLQATGLILTQDPAKNKSGRASLLRHRKMLIGVAAAHSA